MENTTNIPETTGAEQTKSLDTLLDQAVDGENVVGGLSVSFDFNSVSGGYGGNGTV